MLIYGNQPILVGFSHISWFLYTVGHLQYMVPYKTLTRPGAQNVIAHKAMKI